MPRILGVIPARYQSERLPGKVLADIAGKPMVVRVFEAAARSPLLDDLLVATDSERVLPVCREYGVPAILTGEHQSGTDRIQEVAEERSADFFVNIQGDEPTIRAEHIENLVRPFLESGASVTTLKVAIDEEEARNPNAVKVVCDLRGRALYFSRSPIPFHRGTEGTGYFKHIGLYGYTPESLRSFSSLPQTPCEKREKLEQLRFLENGIEIHVSETGFDTLGVDTEDDLEAVRRLFETS